MQGLIDALNKGTNNCMADIERAGLPFFDVSKNPKTRRRVENYLDSRRR
jgi:hypothetical protein